LGNCTFGILPLVNKATEVTDFEHLFAKKSPQIQIDIFNKNLFKKKKSNF